jgi:chromate transport protein ChrA
MMGHRLVGTLAGVVVGVIPGFALIFITAAVTNGFEDQAGMPFGLLGMLLIVAGAVVGGIQGAQRMPATRGQTVAGVLLGALPGLALWRLLNEINTVALILLIVGPLWLGILGWRADHQDHSRPLAH